MDRIADSQRSRWGRCTSTLSVLGLMTFSTWQAAAANPDGSWEWIHGDSHLLVQGFQQPVAPAQPQQPQAVPVGPPAPPPPAPPPELDVSPSPLFVLASVPNMFGDAFGPMQQVLVSKPAAGPFHALADLPLGAIVRRAKVSENNKALPMNRIYLNYTHFHNAFEAQSDIGALPADGVPTGPIDSSPLDRYVIGLEKTFCDCASSVELRMPFAGSNQFETAIPVFGVAGGEVGNLLVIFKRLLYIDRCSAIAAGIGIDIPTGDDVTGFAQADQFTIHNDAVHLKPYVGFLGTPSRNFFYHTFIEVDVPANGNRVEFSNTALSGVVGKLNEQTLLNLDGSIGWWLWRNPCASHMTGLASLLELHYTTTLQDAHDFNITPSLIDYTFSNRENRLDILNLTVALEAVLRRNTTLRVGGVFPLRDKGDELFDSEVQVQLNRYF